MQTRLVNRTVTGVPLTNALELREPNGYLNHRGLYSARESL